MLVSLSHIGVRQGVMLYNNFNKTQDIARANLRLLKIVDWTDGGAIVVMALAVLGMLVTVAVGVIMVVWISTPVVSYSSPASVCNMHARIHTHPLVHTVIVVMALAVLRMLVTVA